MIEKELSKNPIPYVQQALTDAELVQLAREDNGYAFNQLMERYQVMAAYIALRIVSNEESAHDLVQEAMLLAFLSLDRLRDDTRFKSWFYGIVLNVCRNSRREGKIETVSLYTPTGNWLSELYSWDEQADPQEYIEQQELRVVLDEALNILSIKNRTVAQLFYYEEMSIQEIAQKLAISLTAVKNRLYKSREQLRVHLLKTSPDMIPTTTRKRGKEKMIKVSIAKVVSQHNYRTLVVLHDEAQQRVLSIWLQANEGSDLVSRMAMTTSPQDVPIVEPLTADFMVNLLQATGSTISSIEIDNLQDELLYARVRIQSHGEERHLKARLNDAIPLALRLNSEFYVADVVMEKLGQKLSAHTKMSEQIDTMSEVITSKMTGMISQTAVMRKEPRNLDFSDGLHGWRFTRNSKDASTYQIDQTVKQSEKGSLLIINRDADPVSSSSLSHEGFLVDNYIGKRLRLYAYMKTDDVKYVVAMIQLIGSKRALPLRKISNPIIRGTAEWTKYEIVFDVPDDTNFINFSLHMTGAGRMWLDRIGFEEVDSSVPVTEDAWPGTHFSEEPQNMHFAYHLAQWGLWGSYPQDYTCGIDTTVGINSATCGYIKSNTTASRGYGSLRQSVRTKRYEGQYVRLLGSIKTSDVENQASLYMRLNTAEGNDELREKSLRGTTNWVEQGVTLFVPEMCSGMIDFGITLYGKGQVWLDNVRLEIVEADRVIS